MAKMMMFLMVVKYVQSSMMSHYFENGKMKFTQKEHRAWWSPGPYMGNIQTAQIFIFVNVHIFIKKKNVMKRSQQNMKVCFLVFWFSSFSFRFVSFRFVSSLLRSSSFLVNFLILLLI